VTASYLDGVPFRRKGRRDRIITERLDTGGADSRVVPLTRVNLSGGAHLKEFVRV
jgi:hypothetical protein